MTSLIKIEDRIEDKTLLIFQHNDKKFVINGSDTYVAVTTKNVMVDVAKYISNKELKLRIRDALNQLNENVSHDDFLTILKFHPLYLSCIESQTPELCMVAVKHDGWALNFVKDQTPELCLEAVKENGIALRFVLDKTPELCMEAVKQNGMALHFVVDQTDALCMEAVKQNAFALYLVQNKTPELRSLAGRANGLTPWS